MPAVSRSRRFLQKAEAALVAAIEIYNKPDFQYREESFAILSLNAWELLLKARILHLHKNDPKCLHIYETHQTKKGKSTKKRFLKRNRAGNCQTLALGQCIVALDRQASPIAPGIKRNLDALTEVRDNSVHYITAGPFLAKQVFEVGTAAVANFLHLSREWFNRDLSKYHLYLMPIGFVAPPKDADTIVVSTDEAHLVQYLSNLAKASDVKPDDPYQVALTLQLKMKRSTSDAAVKVVITDDPNAPKVVLTEEDFRASYPWDYGDLTSRLRKRYSDFMVTRKYHTLRKSLVNDSRYCMSRFLDPGNPKSSKKDFFSPNVLNEFDKAYSKRDGAA